MWNDKIQVKKGNIGEQLVLDYLEEKGFVVYKPITNSAHCFDNLAIKNKKTAMIAEVKTKARMNRYEATGFNYKHYQEYKFISSKYNLPVFVFFVDEFLQKIYGNWLSLLEKEVDGYPRRISNDAIILFSLKNMVDVCILTEKQCQELKNLSIRKHEYNVEEQ